MKVAAAAGSELAWWRGHVRLERGVLDDLFRLSLRMLRFVEVVVSRCGRYRFDEAGVSDVRRVETRAVGVQVERAIGLKLHVSIDGSWNRDRFRKFVHALPLAGRSCRVRVGRVCVNCAIAQVVRCRSSRWLRCSAQRRPAALGCLGRLALLAGMVLAWLDLVKLAFLVWRGAGFERSSGGRWWQTQFSQSVPKAASPPRSRQEGRYRQCAAIQEPTNLAGDNSGFSAWCYV